MGFDARVNQGIEIDRLKLQSEISKYDKLWDEWRVLEHSSRFCATIYTDLAFRNQKSGSIGELVDSLRELCR